MSSALPPENDPYSVTGSAYDKIGETYEEVYVSDPERDRSLDWLISRLKPGSRILEIGSATGKPSAERLTKSGYKVTGIDVSQKFLRLARRNVPDAEFVHADVRYYSPEPESFDAIYTYYMLFHISRSDIRETIRKIYKWLKPAGLFTFLIVPGDFEGEPVPFMGQTFPESALPVKEYLSLLRETGFLMWKYSVTLFETPESYKRLYVLNVFAQKPEAPGQNDMRQLPNTAQGSWKSGVDGDAGKKDPTEHPDFTWKGQEQYD